MAIYTQTVEQVKRDVARSVGGLIADGTADSASASTLVHDELKRFTKDDALNGKEVDIVGGTNAGENLEINDFEASSGTITVVPDWSTTCDETSRYHVYDPSIVTARLLEELIAEAVRSLGRQRLVNTANRKLILDDLLAGRGDMETWTASTTPDDWTADGNSTWSEETTAAKVRVGSSSAKVITDGTNLGSITYAIEPHYKWNKYTLKVKGWVWTATASRVTVLGTYGTEFASSAHGGDSKWEHLATDATLVDDPSALSVLCRVSAGSAVTAYFDHVRALSLSPIYEYTLPSGLVAISRIFVESEAQDGVVAEVPPHLYHIDRSASTLIIDRSKWNDYTDRRLHIIGLSSLTAPDSDDDAVEVPEYIKAFCRYHILERQGSRVSVERLGFAKRVMDEQFALAKRIPASRNLKWVER